MWKQPRAEASGGALRRCSTALGALLFTIVACGGISGETEQDHVTVTASEAAAQGAPVEGVTQATRIEEWLRSPACRWGGYRHDLYPGCITPADEITVLCPDGSEALDPWWMRYRRTSGTW